MKCQAGWILCALALAAGCDESGGPSAELRRQCAVASSCADAEGTSIGTVCNMIALIGSSTDDRTTELKLSKQLVRCVQAAGDCDDMRACVQASEQEALACEGAGNKGRCAGDVLVECAGYPDKTPDAFDCAAAGLVCGQDASDAACGEELCDPATDATYCDGDLLVECDGNVYSSRDCRYYIGLHCSSGGGGLECSTRAGGTCGTDADGELACVGDGDPCDEDTFQNRCDGSTMVTCNRGKESSLNCKQLHTDLECDFDTQSGAVTCEPSSQECPPDGNEKCEGGIVTFCLMGEVVEVNCMEFDLSGCAVGSENDRTIAYCVP